MHHVSDVYPGRLIGDLAILINEPRQLDLVATEDAKFLRIGAEQYRAVVESDKTVVLSLLHKVAGYLAGASDIMMAAGLEVPREFGPHRRNLQSQEPEE